MTRRAGPGIDLPRSCFTREQFSFAVYNGFLELFVRREFLKKKKNYDRTSLVSPTSPSVSSNSFNDNSPRRISINAFERNRWQVCLVLSPLNDIEMYIFLGGVSSARNSS